MATSSLFALIDDIATMLDDVAVMTKVAAKKTAGVLGDDLALNAQQVSGVSADREIPVVWAVAKGSFVNKAILVPAALAISVFLPKLITPLLMIGGAYLCFEGVEKLAHKYLHLDEEDAAHEEKLHEAAINEDIDLVQLEKDKIKGAIRTDFILSAEIITIALGTVADKPLTDQVGVLVGIAILMTVGVYGLVAGIVKLDDLGLYLSRKSGLANVVGRFLLFSAPWLMKTLSIAGTVAMFLVGGGILVHGLTAIHHAITGFIEAQALTGFAASIVTMLAEGLVGIAAGIVVLLAVTGIKKLLPKSKAQH